MFALFCRIAVPLVLLTSLSAPLAAGEGGSRLDGPAARAAMRKAVRFFREEVSSNGGYLWRYSADLSQREGERKADAETVWVQPPGTPTVGEALLTAFLRTGDDVCERAALDAGEALRRGRLVSGGWDYAIHFDPDQRRRYAYAVDLEGDDVDDRRNVTTLDDDTTQSAVRFLVRLDEAFGFENRDVGNTARAALEALLKAQYPNGAWPQRFSGFPEAEDFPVKKASYPEEWSRTHPKRDYRHDYTLNDNTLADVIATLFLAADVYGEERYREAAERGGDFLILAQMPEPQPAWAQQYDRDMQPAWARRFEPPSITGGESQGALQTLLLLYRETGKEKYLEPIPRAVEYLKKSRLPDGRLARFYELETNRPLYFTKQYELTYSDDDLPTHYGFQVGSGKLERIERDYVTLREEGPPEKKPREQATEQPNFRLTESLRKQAAAVVAALDDRGAWVEEGRMRDQDGSDTNRVIETRTFTRNLDVLSRFVAAAEAEKQ